MKQDVIRSYENYREEDRLTTNNARRIEFLTTVRIPLYRKRYGRMVSRSMAAVYWAAGSVNACFADSARSVP